MSDNKDKQIIKKLLKIADNHQRIIAKLAQLAMPTSGATVGWADVSDDLAEKLHSIPNTTGYAVTSAEVSPTEGVLRAKISHPNDENFHSVVSQLKKMLAGSQMRTDDNKTVSVSRNEQDLNFIGMS